MWDLLLNYGLFLLKVLTVLAAVVVIILLLAKDKLQKKDPVSFECVNDTFADTKQTILQTFAQGGALYAKNALAQDKKAQSLYQKQEKKRKEASARLFVLSFKGNLYAEAVKALREEITAILLVATPQDSVMVKVDSPGGSVIDYGLAAAQLVRIRDAGLHISVCVDRVAASGGYMMACVAHKIYAAPFAYVGSIGVVMSSLNFHNLLKKHDVDVIELTAGENKRPLSAVGEVTNEGKQHVKGQLQAIHDQFKSMVATYRPELDIEAVTKGDVWTASNALQIGLVDALITSDSFIANAVKEKKVFSVTTLTKPDLMSMLMGKAASCFERLRYGFGQQ